MTMHACVFPGQGSQYVGMGKDLFDNFDVARHVMEEAEDALHERISSVMFDGPSDDLMLTHNTQPALLIASMMAFRVLQHERNQQPHELAPFMAGHSLGEYSALCAAGHLTLRDAVYLVRLRGQAMQNAVPVGIGAMAAILGLDMDVLDPLLIDVSRPDHCCVIANDNSPGQIVISGHKDAVDIVIKRAVEAGAKRGLLLPVSAPFHSPLMAPAADVMADAFASIKFSPSLCRVVANVTAMPFVDESFIADVLVKQITGRVRWCETIAHLKQLGVTHCTEVGAGKVLCGLIKRIDSDMVTMNIQESSDIKAFLAV